MKKITLVILSMFLLIVSCSACGGTDKQVIQPSVSMRNTHVPQSFIDKMSNSTGIVTQLGTNDMICSGVWISTKRMLTANHCAVFGTFDPSDEDSFYISAGSAFMGKLDIVGRKVNVAMVSDTDQTKSYDTVIKRHRSARIVAIDTINDIALLEAEGFTSPYWSNIMATGNVMQSESVYALGHPGGLTYSYSEGYISYERRLIEVNEFVTKEALMTQVMIGVYKGNSGCALFNRDGEIVGILSGMMAHQSFFSHVDNIRALVWRAD